MKINFKSLIIGIVIGVMIAGSSVFAITGAIQKTLEYNDIKITLNGQEILPTDANGTYVEPFTIDGTTYLPVRAIGNALGLSVDWNDETKTVILGKDTSSGTQASGNVIYDKDGIRISYDGFVDYTSYQAYKLLVENNSDSSKLVGCFEVYADGFLMEHVSDSGIIDPGKKAILTFDILSYVLEECGITDIGKFEFKLNVSNFGSSGSGTYLCEGLPLSFEL